MKTANVDTDYKDCHIISKENRRVEKKRGKVVNEGRKQSGTKDRALGDPRRGKPRGGVGVKDTGNLKAIGEVRSEPCNGSGGQT